MEVTKVKIYPYNVKYGKLGKCQVILDHELLLTGLTLMDYYGKRYVIYPKNVNNKRELCFVQPIKKPLADKINKAVFEAYDKMNINVEEKIEKTEESDESAFMAGIKDMVDTLQGETAVLYAGKYLENTQPSNGPEPMTDPEELEIVE